MTQLPILTGADSESIPREVPEGGLDDVILTLRNAIAKLSAGDTTLSFAILTQSSTKPLFTLGSKGRFYHPKYGIIGATYVKFATVISEENSGSPVGFFRQQIEFVWEVTASLIDSAPRLALGLAGPYGRVETGSYGWVITDGINIQTVKTGLTILPTSNVELTWVADGTIGIGTGPALGLLAAKSKLTDFPNAVLHPAGMFLGRAGTRGDSNDAFDALQVRISALESAARGGLSRNEFIDFRRIINEQIATLNRTAGINSQTQLIETVNESLAAIERTLFASATFQNLAATDAENAQAAALNAQTSLLAVNRESQLVRAFRDQAGFHVEASREASLQAQLSNNETLVNSIIAFSASVQASNSAASANQSAVTAASIGPNLLNPNAEFRDYPWDGVTANPVPAQWFSWATTGMVTRERVSSVRGGFAIKDSHLDAFDALGVYQIKSIPPLSAIEERPYVYEMDIYLESGTLRGAGGYLNCYNAAGVSLAGQPFGIPNPVGGPRATGRIYRFRTPIALPAGTAQIEIHAITNWTGFNGVSGDPKVVQWLRCGVRAASQGEIDGTSAVAGVISANAAIVAETNARVTADSALTTSINSQAASFNSALTTTNSNVSNEMTNRANADSSLASSISSLSASVASQNSIFSASISAQGTAIAGINSAAASFDLITAATGSEPAVVALKAGIGGSLINLVAQRLMVGDYSSPGVVREIARFEGGQAILNDALIRNLQVAPHPDATVFFGVELKPKMFLAADGDVVSFGGTLINPPSRILPVTSSISLAAGEVADVKAVGISPTQFTCYAKRTMASSPSAQYASGFTDNPGSTPRWQADKPTTVDSFDSFYQYSFNAQFPRTSTFTEGGVRYNTFAGTIGFYAMLGGSWSLISTQTYNIESTSSSAVAAPGFSSVTTFVETVGITAAIGATGAKEFGVHPNGTVIVNNFNEVKYATQIAGSVTSIAGLIPFMVYP